MSPQCSRRLLFTAHEKYHTRPLCSLGTGKNRLGNLIFHGDLEKLKSLLGFISDAELRAECGGKGDQGGKDGYGLFCNSSPLLHSALCGGSTIFAALVEAFSSRQVGSFRPVHVAVSMSAS